MMMTTALPTTTEMEVNSSVFCKNICKLLTKTTSRSCFWTCCVICRWSAAPFHRDRFVLRDWYCKTKLFLRTDIIVKLTTCTLWSCKFGCMLCYLSKKNLTKYNMNYVHFHFLLFLSFSEVEKHCNSLLAPMIDTSTMGPSAALSLDCVADRSNVYRDLCITYQVLDCSVWLQLIRKAVFNKKYVTMEYSNARKPVLFMIKKLLGVLLSQFDCRTTDNFISILIVLYFLFY